MIVLVMGVAGSGKTLIGSMLAESLGWKFADADDFHPAANIEKMSRGIPLTDADRSPWLMAMHEAIQRWIAAGANVVLACSALKREYRNQLWKGPELPVVYLKGDIKLIHSRLAARRGHFMKAAMLESQLADLEEPEDAIVVEVSQTPEEIVARIKSRLTPIESAGKADPSPRAGGG
jgi:gluconokinase